MGSSLATVCLALVADRMGLRADTMSTPSDKIRLSSALKNPASAKATSVNSRNKTTTSAPPTASGAKPAARLSASSAPTATKPSKPNSQSTQQAKTQTKAQRSSFSTLLPGGLWLWCLAGLAIGLTVWSGGRYYLRMQLAAELQNATDEKAAIESIDALLRLDGNATIEVTRGLSHPEFMVANAAYRALAGQLNAWHELKPADQLRRMQQVVAQLQAMPDDLDSDHRILITGLASRIYAEALGNHENGAADLLTACKRIMSPSNESADDGSTDSTTRIAQLTQPEPITRTLVDADSPVPPPLPPRSLQYTSDIQPNPDAAKGQAIRRNLSDDDENNQPATQPAKQPAPDGAQSSALRSSRIPQLTTAGRGTGVTNRALVHLTANPGAESNSDPKTVKKPEKLPQTENADSRLPVSVPMPVTSLGSSADDRKPSAFRIAER